MPVPENTVNTYAWLITFLIYNDINYDREHNNVTGYIPMEWQKNSIYASVGQMAIHEKIKVVFVEVNIDKTDISVLMRTSTPLTSGLTVSKAPNIPLEPSIMTSKESLSKILAMVLAENQATRNIIVTIGHGSIFGINLQKDPSTNKDNQQLKYIFPDAIHKKPALTEEQIERFKRDSIYAATLGSKLLARYNLQSNTAIKFLNTDAADSSDKYMEQYFPKLNLFILTVGDINAALKTNFLGKRVDVLLLDNCVMQNLFCQYELRQTVDYFVAAQSGISFPGFNYASMIKKIGEEIEYITPGSIAKHLVDKDTIRTHPDYQEHSAHIEHCWCVSAIRLDDKLYETIHTQFADLTDQLMLVMRDSDKKIYREIPNILAGLIDETFNYSIYCLVDIPLIDFAVFLDLFIKRLEENTILEGHKDAILTVARELLATLSTVPVDSFIGKKFYPAAGYHDPGLKIGFGFLLPLKDTGTKLVDLQLQEGEDKINLSFFEQTQFYKLISEIRMKS